MGFTRIGDKVVSRDRIVEFADRVLEMRGRGLSQQEVADRLGVDRTLISRLEGIGEVRKGGVTALIAFPIANIEEIEALAEELGLDFALVMTNAQRWSFVEGKTGIALLNDIMGIMSRARECQQVVVAASTMWLGLAEALLGPRLTAISLGGSPLAEDVYLDPDAVRAVVAADRGERRVSVAGDSPISGSTPTGG